VTGIVADISDPNGQGRIKVTFPWLSENHQSAWAPIAAPQAGKQRGHWFMPEIGDEVLVAFEQGDFAHPFIIGFLWNGVDTPPDTDPKHRILITPGGHELRFEDNDGAKKVVLKSSAGFTVEMNESAKTLALETPGGLSMTLDDASSSIQVKGGGRQISLSGGQVQIT
jgi:phage baseplate assembly protein V